MYSNLILEMLIHRVGIADLCNHLSISEYDVIRKLKNEIPITCNEAKLIKCIIGSELPLEALFEIFEVSE